MPCPRPHCRPAHPAAPDHAPSLTAPRRAAPATVRAAAALPVVLPGVLQIMLPMVLLAGGAAARASELVYQPLNPAFGGYPANGQHLLAVANATNKHTEGGLGPTSLFDQSPLAQFNQTLERTVLSQLAAAATSRLTGADGKLLPGTFSTANFTITVIDLGGGMLRITTVDKSTGASTSFEVAQ